MLSVPAMPEAQAGGSEFEDSPSKVNETLSDKQNTNKRVGVVDQVVECLLSMC
jgi:hypothetical protein